MNNIQIINQDIMPQEISAVRNETYAMDSKNMDPEAYQHDMGNPVNLQYQSSVSSTGSAASITSLRRRQGNPTSRVNSRSRKEYNSNNHPAYFSPVSATEYPSEQDRTAPEKPNEYITPTHRPIYQSHVDLPTPTSSYFPQAPFSPPADEQAFYYRPPYHQPYVNMPATPLIRHSSGSYRYEPFHLVSSPTSIQPVGHFIQCDPLPILRPSDITRNHYVVSTVAMAGPSQADVMDLLFYIGSNPSKSKIDHEITIPWRIDNNNSLVTLSQGVFQKEEESINDNYLLRLGKRIGITSILVILSLDSFNTIHQLFTILMSAMKTETEDEGDGATSPSWWKRVILIVNCPSTLQNINIRMHEFLNTHVPEIQAHYKLQQPPSVVFLSTEAHSSLPQSPERDSYQRTAQRILWRMMDRHMKSGRWVDETVSTSNNTEDDDDDESSSEDEKPLTTVIYGAGQKKKRPTLTINTDVPIVKEQLSVQTHFLNVGPTAVQRRVTRRQYQKANAYDTTPFRRTSNKH